ncbi:hypothetical protein [Sphingomonas sp.]|uniref:hypothetical protein n=1 Tax=Sphingomonas sp. TaxID=28214 RepID=UPI0028A5B6FC|nr:hypothetical protein [Sphingomonas sp.]
MTVARSKRTDVLFALIALLLFLVPAAINRSPILYPDSVGYFQAGKAATSAAHIPLSAHPTTVPGQSGPSAKMGIDTEDGVSDARSVYYGAAFALSWAVAGVWALPVLQALLCVLAIYAALGRMAPDAPRTLRWAVVAGIGLIGGAGIFATTVMPDVFAGLMILAVAMIAIYRATLTRTELLAWLALGVAAILFHKSHLLLALGMLAALFLLGLVTHRQRWASLGLIALLIVAGGLGQLAFGLAARHAGLTVYSPPFVMARLIGDRTAEKYLRETCPQTHYATCRFLPRMPMTENEFLWSGDGSAVSFATLSAAEKARICDEQWPIVLGTLRSHGLEQLGKSLTGVFRQIATVGVTEYGLMPRDALTTLLHPDIQAYHRSGIGHHTMPLRLISGLMLACYALGGVALVILAARVRGQPGGFQTLSAAHTRLFEATLLVVFAVLLNGAVCGAISGVFDRYQGRVAWLIPLFALAILMEVASSRRGAAA